MDTTVYRVLISETFTKCFAVSLQTEIPKDYVEELFISFVLSKFFNERKERNVKTGGLEFKGLDERFIYNCVPKFLNWLTIRTIDEPSKEEL